MKLYTVSFPELGVTQTKLLIQHSVYLEYLKLPYETKEEQSFAKSWFSQYTKGYEWFTEQSPYYKAITTESYSANLSQPLKCLVVLKSTM